MGVLPALGGAHTAGTRGLLSLQLVLATAASPWEKGPSSRVGSPRLPQCSGGGGVSRRGHMAAGGGETLATRG